MASVTATQPGSCPGSTAGLVSLKLDHVWVKAVIGGTAFYFDPSFKPHTIKPGINLATASGYDPVAYLAQARSGATITTDYVQGIHRANIHSNLNAYATNLANYLRTNLPTSTVDDVVGGMTIIPHSGGPLRQTELPYRDTSVPVTEWTEIPASYKPLLRIQYHGIDKTFSSDAIYGKRLTITYPSGQPVLMLDGVIQASGMPITPGTVSSVTFTITHGAYAQPFANQTVSQSIKAGGTYLIGNGWGPASRGLIAMHRQRLEEAKAAGQPSASELSSGYCRL